MWRETLSSLKACHASLRLVSAILYDRPVDVFSMPCSGCGSPLRAGWADGFGFARCPTCGRVNQFPAHVVGQIRQEKPELISTEPGPFPPAPARTEFVARCRAESERAFRAQQARHKRTLVIALAVLLWALMALAMSSGRG
jgi:hypothetical protein